MRLRPGNGHLTTNFLAKAFHPCSPHNVIGITEIVDLDAAFDEALRQPARLPP